LSPWLSPLDCSLLSYPLGPLLISLISLGTSHFRGLLQQASIVFHPQSRTGCCPPTLLYLSPSLPHPTFFDQRPALLFAFCFFMSPRRSWPPSPYEILPSPSSVKCYQNPQIACPLFSPFPNARPFQSRISLISGSKVPFLFPDPKAADPWRPMLIAFRLPCPISRRPFPTHIPYAASVSKCLTSHTIQFSP